MITTTSSSECGRFWGLYRSTLRRNRGYFSLLCALMAFFYPVQYLLEVAAPPSRTTALFSDPMDYYTLLGLGKNYTFLSAVFFTGLMLAAPLILGLLLHGYMHSRKAVDVYHALPVSRGRLLGVNAAAAMTMIAIPVVASDLVISVAQVFQFGFDAQRLGWLWLDCLGWLICAFAVYAVTTFVSVCVGTVFDTLVFSGVLLLSMPVLLGLYLLLGNTFLYGWITSESVSYTALMLSPVTLMPSRFRFSASDLADPADQLARQLLGRSNLAVLAWLVLGLLIFWVAVRIYRVRRSELAEATTSRGVLQVLVKLVGVLVCGTALGLLFFALQNGEQRESVFFFWAAVTGLLTYCIIEVILNRGFRTLVRSLPLGACMVAVLLACPAAMATGGLGYEQRVPDLDRVASVEVSYTGRYGGFSPDPVQLEEMPLVAQENGQEPDLDTINQSRITRRFVNAIFTQPENIQTLLDVHRTAAQEQFDRQPSEENGVFLNYQVTYHLENGGHITRRYDRFSTENALMLAPLEASGELLAQRHPAFFDKGEDIVHWSFQNLYGDREERSFTDAQSQEWLDAIRADLEATPVAELLQPQGRLLAIVEFSADYPPQARERFARSGWFQVTESTPRTRALLEEYGLLEALEPDWSACQGVVATVGNSTSWRDGNTSILAEMSPAEYGYGTDYEEVRQGILEDREYREQNPEPYLLTTAQGDPLELLGDERVSWDNTLIEDPAQIQLLASLVVPCWQVGEPVAELQFYFDQGSAPRVLLVPLERIPQQLRSQFYYYQFTE